MGVSRPSYWWHQGDARSNVFWQKLAFLLPKKLVYWASIRLMSAATVGDYADTVVTDLTVMEALKRWDDTHS